MVLLTLFYVVGIVLLAIGYVAWPSVWSVVSILLGSTIIAGLVWAML